MSHVVFYMFLAFSTTLFVIIFYLNTLCGYYLPLPVIWVYLLLFTLYFILFLFYNILLIMYLLFFILSFSIYLYVCLFLCCFNTRKDYRIFFFLFNILIF